MENQMKIVFVTLNQFNLLLSKLLGYEKVNTERLTTLSFMCRRLNTLFIVGKKEDFVADVESIISDDRKWKQELLSLGSQV